MSDFNTSKIDGNTVGASEWNQLADVDNFVISSGQTPSTSNLEQLGIGSARYSSGGQFFTDSGTANAYVLSPVSPFKSPVSSGAGEGYFNGMIISFRAGNANSGASTVNVNSAGVKNLKKADGTNVATGDILTTSDVTFRYDGTNFVKVEYINQATATTAGIQTLVPIGSIIIWAVPTIPANYLICDGAAISRTTYANLFNTIGTYYGPGNGSTTFTLPDYRGLFLRGQDNGGSTDPGRYLGSYQEMSIQSHSHFISVSNETIAGGGSTIPCNRPGGIQINTNSVGGTETRPKNASVHFIIKYS